MEENANIKDVKGLSLEKNTEIFFTRNVEQKSNVEGWRGWETEKKAKHYVSSCAYKFGIKRFFFFFLNN